MFIVKKILNENVKSSLEIDFYVPVTVEFPLNDAPFKELYYYCILNKKHSFVEIKINSESKKIYEIIVVSINDIKDYSSDKVDFSNIPELRGNPVIDVEVWGGKKNININDEFSVMYNNEDRLVFLLENIGQVTQRLVLPNVELLLTESNQVVGFVFYDIPIDKRKDLKEGIVASTARCRCQ